MINFLNIYYNWLLAFHVISIISWMAGMLYLPRIFVYHTYAELKSKQSETFKIMERRLYKYIMNPAMISSWFFGLLMLYAHWDLLIYTTWMQIKIISVIIMTIIHFIFIKYLEDFAEDKNVKSTLYFRILNEVPTLLMIIIIIFVIIKPF